MRCACFVFGLLNMVQRLGAPVRPTFVSRIGATALACLLTVPGLTAAAASPPSRARPYLTVATVAHSPEPFGKITRAALHRSVEQIVAQARLTFPSAPPPSHRRAQDSALTELLDMADIEGEAKELGVTISERKISQRLRRIRESTFGSTAAFRKYLHQAKLAKSDVRERVSERRATQGVQGQIAMAHALLKFFRDFAKRWRARTICAPAVTIKRCSNWGQS